MPEIRLLTEADRNELLELRRTALLDTPSAFLASPEDDRLSSEAAARELLRPQTHSAVFGACVPQLAGMVGIYRDSARKAAHKAHLWGVFVLPAHRGHGFARLLLEAALLHARSWSGVTAAHLSVNDSTPAAKRVYEGIGFRTWGVEPDAIRVGGHSYADCHMILTL